MKKEDAVLVVSFGTSYNDSRKKTIEEIEKTIAGHFHGYEFHRAFTSRVIINILKKRDSISIDGVSEAMERLLNQGIKRVLVQPTHVMSGEEFDAMMEEMSPYEASFEAVAVGAPLLTSDEDYERLVRILAEDTKEFDQEGTEIILMGHGTEHAANEVYVRLAAEFKKQGYVRYHVGTVEATPSLEDMKRETDQTGARRVVLQPLMIVAGDHANNDMAGDEEDSWKSVFQADGYDVVCRRKGLGELEGIRSMFVDHAKMAVRSLTFK